MSKDHKELIEFLGDHFENIDQRLEHIDQKFEHVDQKFEHIDQKFEALDNKISQLPTKSYLDDKMADLEGGVIGKLRKEDQKINRLAEILQTKKVLNETDSEELGKLQVFPR